MIGGYSESFNTLRICRICMATKDEIQTSVSVDSAMLFKCKINHFCDPHNAHMC